MCIAWHSTRKVQEAGKGNRAIEVSLLLAWRQAQHYYDRVQIATVVCSRAVSLLPTTTALMRAHEASALGEMSIQIVTTAVQGSDNHAPCWGVAAIIAL